MKRIIFLFLATVGICLSTVGAAPGVARKVKLTQPLGNSGTFIFTLEVNKPFRNGYGEKKQQNAMFSLGSQIAGKIYSNQSFAGIHWTWRIKWPKGRENYPGMRLLLPEVMPGQKYRMLYSWDAVKGYFDCYYNGWPVRIPGSKFAPWQVKPIKDLKIYKGPFKISDIKTLPLYTPQKQVAKLVPKTGIDPFGSKKALFSKTQIDKMRGKLLYSNKGQTKPFSDWVKDGPVMMSFHDGWAKVWSNLEGISKRAGHIVWWCPEDFPDSFIAEWQVKIVKEHGLCIVFFAARGVNGNNVFDPALKKRNGTFANYIKEDLTSYHVSYFTNAPMNPGRPQTNLRKNNKFFLVAQGECGIQPKSNQVHKVTLIKVKNRINMLVDGKSVLSWTDPGTKRYGKAWTDGNIGLRHMRWTVADYRNFQVWAVKQ
jgi:Domain of unknown function (DUF1961)